MGRLRNVGLWSLAAVALVTWIPNVSCGSTPKAATKVEKTTKAPSQEKLPAASRKEPTAVPFSVEDEENFSGQRGNFAPFPPGFAQGAPPRYNFGGMQAPRPDSPSDRFDIEDAPGDSENHGMGFMPEFGPPKGFPDLSKLTGGEFSKMGAPSNGGGIESYGQGGGKNRPFHQFSPQGGPHGYEDSDDGPSEPSPFGAGPAQSVTQFQGAPKRRPFRGRPNFSSGRPSGFGGPSGSSGPGPYGAPDGIGESGPFGSPDGIYGAGPGPYGGGPGSDGPSSRPFGGRPSRPGGPFGSSSGPSSRPGLFGSGLDGPPSRPSPFGSDGPSSRPGVFGGGPDGPSSSSNPFGPGGSSDGPERPSPFGSSSDDPSSRPGPFGIDGSPGGGPYDSSDGPSRPGPSFLSLDGAPGPRPFGGPNRPGPFNGPPKRPGSFNAPGGGPNGPSPFGGPGSGRNENPQSAYSFSTSGPNPGQGFRLSRGYPRYHPNQIHNDDFKESADNGDFTPSNNGPQRLNYHQRQQANFRPGSDDYEQGPSFFDGPRQRARSEYGPGPQRQQSNGGNPFGNTHRFDSPKRPFVIKVSGLKSSKNTRELPPGPPVFYAPSPDMKTKDGSRKLQEKGTKDFGEEGESSRAKSYLVKLRPKRDLEHERSNNTATASSTPCKSDKERGCRALSQRFTNRKKTHRDSSRVRKTGRKQASNSTRISKPAAEDPMQADGTQQTDFWDVSPGFGAFNNFKKQTTHHRIQDRHDEYDDGDEEDEVPAAAPVKTSRKNQTFLDTTSDEQRFFPSFPAPPSPYLNPFASSGGFARPPVFPGPTANRAPSRFHQQFSPKYTQPHTNRGPGSAYPAESHDRYLQTNLLGSGNFEVVRGGTYYGEEDNDAYHHASGATGPAHYHQQQHDDDDSYFHHNGHASPHGYRNNPSAGGDFFANFRDFADINPPARSFSHHHETVADAEPHGSGSEEHRQPKNILDKLESSSYKVEVHQPYAASTNTRDSDPMLATF